MGGVGDFFFGSPSKGKQTSNSTSTYSNQSQSASQSGNLAYPELNQSLYGTTGYVSSAGDMLAALLGLPTSSSTPSPAPASAPPQSNPSLPPVALPPVQSPPAVTPPSASSGSGNGSWMSTGSGLHNDGGLLERLGIRPRANGGPVEAGQPYVVGEKQPELFVPNQSGTIIPSVPSATSSPPGGSALNNWANSGGMQFILGQGTNAINSSQAAKGMFGSGATGKALEEFGLNTGKTYLDSYMGHLLDLAKLGQGSAGTLAQAGQYSNSAAQSSGSGGSTSVGTGTTKGGKEGLIPGMLVGAAQGAGQAAGGGA